MTRRNVVRAAIYTIIAALATYALSRIGVPIRVAPEDISRIVDEIERRRSEQPPLPSKSKYEVIYNPSKSTYRISHGNSGCSATVIDRHRDTGAYILVTAAHCVSGERSRVSVHVPSMGTITGYVVAYDRQRDAAVIETTPTDYTLYASRVSTTRRPLGRRVWHIGYGVDRPGNREAGTIIGYDDTSSQYMSDVSVSSGDSGSGVHDADDDTVCGTVCCVVSSGGRRWTQFTDISVHMRIYSDMVYSVDRWNPVDIPTIERR